MTPEEYDRIITGDLGSVGQTVLIDLLRERELTSPTGTWTVVSRF